MAGELEFADRERTEFGWAWTKPHPLGWVPFAVCLFAEGMNPGVTLEAESGRRLVSHIVQERRLEDKRHPVNLWDGFGSSKSRQKVVRRKKKTKRHFYSL